ncbi:LytR/AlgR family response regulator transcription factor [Crocinitomix catalasitica]|uniref:LytR/AlgR family response regulator transcription factor n=1 Tax=Crocinitomix catalasitica TaxID=184607 RepID=UPI000488E2E5|nr:LytTR family DNA-binding domain-containing protein [Crocinitomix catalasitica]
MINAILIEDSKLARLELVNLIQNSERINLIGEATNGAEAIAMINSKNPDLIFLDIHLPDMNGFDVLNEINTIPSIIFTTAYDEYAVKSFEYNTLDYLLKPIKKDRFQQAIEKIVTEKEETSLLTTEQSIFIKDSEKVYIAKLADVSLFETEGNYTKVFFKDKSPLLHKSMNQIESRLDKDVFFRVNRQQLINIHHIVDVNLWFKGKLKLRLTNNQEIEVSERQSIALKRFLSF